MKLFILFLLLFPMNIALADEVICYEYGKVVYKNLHCEKVSYTKNLFVFVEKATKDIIVTNEKCTIKIFKK